MVCFIDEDAPLEWRAPGNEPDGPHRPQISDQTMDRAAVCEAYHRLRMVSITAVSKGGRRNLVATFDAPEGGMGRAP